jgi:hypothetical protein
MELIIENTGARSATIDTIDLAWNYAPESTLARFETQGFVASFETQENLPLENRVPFKPIFLKGGGVHRRFMLFTENRPDYPSPKAFSAGKHLCKLTLHGNSEELSTKNNDFALELTLDSQYRLEDATGTNSLSVKITPVSRQ